MLVISTMKKPIIIPQKPSFLPLSFAMTDIIGRTANILYPEYKNEFTTGVEALLKTGAESPAKDINIKDITIIGAANRLKRYIPSIPNLIIIMVRIKVIITPEL